MERRSCLNLRAIFAQLPGHEIVEHPWVDHGAFKRVVASMNVVAQASFSETFNIDAADAVNVNVSLVTSKEVAWTAQAFHADPTNSDDIAGHLLAAYRVNRRTTSACRGCGPKAYNHASRLAGSAIWAVDALAPDPAWAEPGASHLRPTRS